jgi:predicted secreted protein
MPTRFQQNVEDEKEKRVCPQIKGFKAVIILAALAVTSLGWAGTTSPSLTINDADNGRTFTCRVGEQITVRTRNPATGGYNIVNPVFNPEILKLQAKKELPPESAPFPKLGDFGSLVFEFEVIGVGETNLTIEIARDWEVNKNPEEYLKVKILASK